MGLVRGRNRPPQLDKLEKLLIKESVQNAAATPLCRSDTAPPEAGEVVRQPAPRNRNSLDEFRHSARPTRQLFDDDEPGGVG